MPAPQHPQPQQPPLQPKIPSSKTSEPTYWFVLGRESLLAAAELRAVLNFEKYSFEPPILKIDENDINDKIDGQKLIKQLGGAIKIAREMASGLSEEKMADIISEELKMVEGKINFGLSLYSQGEKSGQLYWLKKFGLSIKKKLKETGLSIRYVENREPILSSVTVDKNGLAGRGREFIITQNSVGTFSIAKTLAVQPFEEFSERDFGRPGRDDLSGMLPPKLAMMMINLAGCPKNGILLDPFCGSGTIITEAILLGYENLIGADISEKAVNDTNINIEWTKNRFSNLASTEQKIQIFKSDVADIKKMIKNPVDAIVAEPYLGKPLRGFETHEQILDQTQELKNLYLAAFQEFYKILKPNGVVVFIIPCFRSGNDWLKINCENDIKKFGFATEKLFENYYSLLYARPDQHVGREIWKFRKT